MPFQKCKIYNDGSHFIAIPHTTRPAVPKRYHPEEVIEVVDNTSQQPQLNTDKCNVETVLMTFNDTNAVDSGECSESVENSSTGEISTPTTTRKITRRQLLLCADKEYKRFLSCKFLVVIHSSYAVVKCFAFCYQFRRFFSDNRYISELIVVFKI